MSSKPKFLLSDNLNKLAKWLRALGYDSLVGQSISLHNLRRIGYRDRRIILTRSRKVARSPHHFPRRLIRSEDSWQQLQEIKDLLEYDEKSIFSRCLECNRVLVPIEKEQIKNLVPSFVFQTQNSFSYCKKCGKIFWKGSHYKDMKKKLDKIFGNRG
ncbi:MAG: uncharacterized protein PWQ09_1586 [Candidatus Cloacimonadota bacterium]|nr:uncharacterized protein [Candidatus Cloacimonadota bacterium]